MKIAVEHIIEIVTREVIAELRRMGFETTGRWGDLEMGRPRDEETWRPGDRNLQPATRNLQPPPFEPDMSAYKTPVLTETRLKRINPMVREIIIPEATVLTPGARDWIRRNSLIIIFKS